MRSLFRMGYRLLLLLIAAFFLVVTFWPRVGPPDFRYTGSDPKHQVLNMGWPVAHLIYDHRLDEPFQWGVITTYILILELLILISLCVLPEVFGLIFCRCQTKSGATPP